MSTWIAFLNQYPQYDLFILPQWLYFDILKEAKEKGVFLPYQIKVDYQYQSKWGWDYYWNMLHHYHLNPYLAKDYSQFYWLLSQHRAKDYPPFPKVYELLQVITNQAYYPSPPELGNRNAALVADANVDLCFQSLPRIGLPLTGLDHSIEIFSCQDEEEQIHATLQKIARQLDEGVLPEQIKILQVHPLLIHRYQQIAVLYGIPLHDSSHQSWSKTPLGIDIYRAISKQTSKAVILEILQSHPTTENLLLIQQFLEELPQEVCENYELLRFLMDEWMTSIPTPQGAIEVSSSLLFQGDKMDYLHVQSVVEDLFPKPIQEKYGLTQAQRSTLRLPSLASLQDHAFNQVAFFIETHPNATYYYPRSAHGVACRLSRVFDTLPISIQPFENHYPSVKSAALHYAYADYLKQTFDREESNYHLFHPVFAQQKSRYNPQFKVISERLSQRLLSNQMSLSATSIELFHHCPFHYLLTYRLKLDPIMPHYAIDSGIFAHRYLQQYFTDAFTQEEVHFPSLSHRSPAYQAWVKTTLKERLNEIAGVLSQQLQGSLFHNEAFELRIQVPLKKDSRYQLVGSVDRLMTYQKDQETLGVVLDYKTGSTGFSKTDFEKGIDVQLILYGFLIEQKQRNINIVGFFHQPIVLGKVPRMDNKDALTNRLRMDGIVLQDESVVRAFDSTSFLRGIQINDNGQFRAGREKRYFTPHEKQEFNQSLIQKIEAMIESMNQGQYFIKPLPLEKNQTISKSCEYCPYQNICFLANKREPFDAEVHQDEEGDETNA